MRTAEILGAITTRLADAAKVLNRHTGYTLEGHSRRMTAAITRNVSAESALSQGSVTPETAREVRKSLANLIRVRTEKVIVSADS